MTDRSVRTAGKLSGLALAAAILAFPAGVAATTNGPIAQTGGMTASFSLLGAPLTAAVTLDASGNITAVTLSPMPAGVTNTLTTPELVKFSSADGNTRVSVKAKGDKLSIDARSQTLAGLVGVATWSANVFGTGPANLTYTIGNSGGSPTLTFGVPAVPAGVTATVIAPTTGSEDGKAFASGGVDFAFNGFVKHLEISVSTNSDGAAKLEITLKGKDRQTLSGALATLGGARTWSAHLCDGTAVAVNYHVDTTTGTVVFDSATGAPAMNRTTGHGLVVRFTGTNVGVQIKLKADETGGTFTLQVKGFSGVCGKGHHGDHDSVGKFGGFGNGFGGFGNDQPSSSKHEDGSNS